jgi:hypothetical protein
VILGLKSKCYEFHDFREICARVEEMFLDVGMSRFNSRGCPVIKVRDFFCPGVNKTGSKRKPSFFNVFEKLRVETGAEYLERGVEISCVGNLGEFRPLGHDLFFFI